MEPLELLAEVLEETGRPFAASALEEAAAARFSTAPEALVETARRAAVVEAAAVLERQAGLEGTEATATWQSLFSDHESRPC